MKIEIRNSEQIDSERIFTLYEHAIAYQKAVGNNHWLGFKPALIAKEIEERRHYKVLAEQTIVCTFCITFSDPGIWKDSEVTSAIYLHRISTSPDFRGNSLMSHIVAWARSYAKDNNLNYIRLDTGSGNDRLINYYKKCGFVFLGNVSVDYTPDLPAHYKDGIFALFQMAV